MSLTTEGQTATESPPVPGRRIAIRGATGSGKTTLGRRLGETLGLPFIELDALFWNPNWVETPPDEFKAKVAAAIDGCPDGWVCDGNYRGRLGNLILARADTLIWLHLPWRVSFWRLLKRTASRAWTREPMWAGNTESWRKAFLSKDSILWWSITHRSGSNYALPPGETPVSIRVYELRSAREVQSFIDDSTQGVRPSTG
ncbi:MAG: hypothetical protein GEU75_10340 [Dehalococcoidia bacterium]|nr:hypothetical protein [Dehalococcoidia bacterium]